MDGATHLKGADPFSFQPASNFLAGGPARTIIDVVGSHDTGLSGSPACLYARARTLAEEQGIALIVDIGSSVRPPAPSYLEGTLAELRTVNSAMRGRPAAEAGPQSQIRGTSCDCENPADLDELAASFDASKPTLVILADVIGRLADPRHLLRTVRQILKQNTLSRLLVCTNERDESGSKSPRSAYFRQWTLDELRCALSAAGFLVTQICRSSGTRAGDDSRTIIAEASCSEEFFANFLSEHRLPRAAKHLILTTEHSWTSEAIRGNLLDAALKPDRLIIFVGTREASERLRPLDDGRGWLQALDVDRLDEKSLSPSQICDPDLLLRTVEQIIFVYDEARLVEFDDHGGIGLRITQAKRAGLLPPSITVVAHAHGNHFYEEAIEGSINLKIAPAVHARERLSLELADHVVFASQHIRDLYVRSGGYQPRSEQVVSGARSFDSGTDLRLQLKYQNSASPRRMPGSLTVIVPNYNGRRDDLADLILGLRNSTHCPSRVIFVDDGSTEKSKVTLQNAASALSPINHEIVFNSQNFGLAATRNVGLAKTATPYICVHDHDNIVLSRFFELACRILDENEDVAAVTAWTCLFDDGEDWQVYGKQRTAYRPLGADLGLGLRENVFGDSLAVYRVDKLRRLGGWDVTSNAMWANWQLLARVVASGDQVWVVPADQFMYRVRADSMQRTHEQFPAWLRLTHVVPGLPKAQAVSLLHALWVPVDSPAWHAELGKVHEAWSAQNAEWASDVQKLRDEWATNIQKAREQTASDIQKMQEEWSAQRVALEQQLQQALLGQGEAVAGTKRLGKRLGNMTVVATEVCHRPQQIESRKSRWAMRTVNSLMVWFSKLRR